MSRVENTTKNFIWSTISTILASILGFISRTVFINILGTTYLGVNGLFTNLLSMLSFAELGIGTAINFSLYKPIADNDIEKIKGLMHFYKKAYQVIAIIVGILGVAVLPFLSLIVKGAEGLNHIWVIYLIFLFNTAYSYLFSYKRTLLYADQKSYLITNVNMIISFVTLVIQLIVLVIFKNYYAYLISSTVIGIAQNFYVNNYINKKYPYLLDKDYENLSVTDKQVITKNVKAMMLHKMGDLCINQTDNIIISSYISVTLVGLVSNYTLIISTINSFIMNVFNSASASLGNLIVTEKEEKRLEVFKGYNFLAFWFFGWATICFYNLLNPFITIWIGEDKIISQSVLSLILFNFYLVGMRVPIGNIKVAAGVYSQDKFVPLVQSVVNLVISILGVQYWGLAGVYLGTVISSLVMPCWYRPLVVYKHVFNTSPRKYFIKYAIYLLTVICNLVIVSLISRMLFQESLLWVYLIGTGIICLIVPNLINFLLFRKTRDFKYIMNVSSHLYRKLVKE
jgi:O-antigen/teichoic acid export membrane protein